MSFNTFFGNTTSSVKNFEIKLEQNVITLRGNGEEAASALLRGTVVLSLAESLTVKNIHLRLTGASRIAWAADLTHPSAGGRYVKQESIFYKHDWMLLEPGKRKSEILPPGSYAYPFELIIPGNTPESIEGLDDSWVVYRMKATIERGLLAPNLHARGHLRIVRTLDPSALELAHAMSVENIWPNKIEYSISTPSKAVIFGTSITVDLRLVPLLKGLKIGKISIVLAEIQDLSTSERSHKVTRDIVTHQSEINENNQTMDEEGQEGWTVKLAVKLPTSLRDCVQDANCRGFKIRHKLKFNVQLLNPDGHISEVRGILPIMIFISPNLPLGEASRTPPGEDAMEFLQQHAPPLYGQHQYDPLYSDIDPSGYMTPVGGTSGVNTPFYSRSQNASSENLASLDAVAQGPASAQLLQSRLNSLRDAGTSRFSRSRNGMLESNPNTPPLTEDDTNHSRLSSPQHDYFSIPRGTGTSSRQSTSNPLSRQVSHENHSPGTHTPEHVEYDQAQLSKVPSYSTAVRSPARIISYDNDDLPNYETAMSQPPSPGLVNPMTPALQLPSGPPSEDGSSGSEGRPSASETIPRVHQRSPSQATSPIMDPEGRKVRLMQARGAH